MSTRGFVPFRNLGGNMSPRAIRYNTRAHNAYQIRIGDPAVMCSAAAGAAVDRAPSLSTAASTPYLGVVVGIYNKNGRPFTFAQPDAGPYVGVSTSGYVEVLTDPNQTYLVNITGTLAAGDIGKYVTVTAGEPNTACGISGFHIAQATNTVNNMLTTAKGALYNQAFPLQIVEFPHFGAGAVDAVEGDHPNQQVEVRIANHLFVPGAGNTGRRAD